MKIVQNRHFEVCLSAPGFARFAVAASLVGARGSVATVLPSRLGLNEVKREMGL
jgi:hypothetical protein